MRFSSSYLAIGCALVAPLMNAPAFANEEDVGADKSGIIVVTANKREQDLQDVSVSVVALSGEALAEQGITDSLDLNGAVPGLRLNYVGGQIQTFVRGVGDTTSNAFTQASVAVNMDGVYVARSSAFRSNFYDIARVEVLRGPQGTLYGRNATGGAINIVTRDPQFNGLDGYVIAEAGNYGLAQVQAASNIPISDTLAMRVAGQIVDRDGFNSDGSGDNKTKSARAKLLWEPNEDLSIKLTFDVSSIGGRGPGRVNRPAQFGDPWEGVTDTRITSTDYPNKENQPNPPYLDVDFYAFSGELNWDLGAASLTIIPAFRSIDVDSFVASRNTFREVDLSDQYSLETRLAGDTGSLSWVVGAYYFKEDLSVLTDNPALKEATQSGRVLLLEVPEHDTEAWAVFGEATFSMTDSLRVIGGFRYTEEDRTKVGTIITTNYVNGVPGTPSVVVADEKLTVDDIGWRAGIEYDLTPDNMLYLTASRGFKSGGFDAPGIDSFDPEYLTAYTLGSKNRFGAITLNLEAFYWDYKDQQVSFLGPNNSGVVSFITRNAGSSTIKGASIEASITVLGNGRLDASAEYLDAKFDDFVYNTVGAPVPAGQLRTDGCLSGGSVGSLRVRDCSGLDLPNAPTFSGNIRYTHDFDLANGGELSFSAASNFSSKVYLSAANFSSPYHQQKSYGLFDASLMYTEPAGNWSIQGYVRNIGNKAVYYQASDNSNIPPFTTEDRSSVAAIGNPRTYGVRFQFNF
jgi:iron complex outermembrane receptor protein